MAVKRDAQSNLRALAVAAAARVVLFVAALIGIIVAAAALGAAVRIFLVMAGL